MDPKAERMATPSVTLYLIKLETLGTFTPSGKLNTRSSIQVFFLSLQIVNSF